MPVPFSIEIIIPNSRSILHAKVVERAARCGEFDGSTLRIDSMLNVFNAWQDFTFVVWAAQKWSGFMVSINDKPILPYNNNYYYYLQQISSCLSSRITASEKQQYCYDSGWSCRLMHGVRRFIAETYSHNPLWYDFGRFVDSDKWQIDKSAIINALRMDSAILLVHHCPYFSPAEMIRQVVALPEIITIDKNWEIRYKIDYDTSGNMVHIPAAIRHLDQVEYFPAPINSLEPEREETDLSKIDLSKMGKHEIDKLLDKMLQQKKRPK